MQKLKAQKGELHRQKGARMQMYKIMGKARGDKGITLLALILTVVIMIILAAVTISVTLGDGGLVDQAKWAAEQTANSTKSEQEQLDDVSSQINDIIAGIGTGSDTNSTGGEDTNQVGETNSVDTNSVDTNSVEDTNTIDPDPVPDPLPDDTISIGQPQWQDDGTANVTVNTTEPDVTIEYQIGGTDEGSWTPVEGGIVEGIQNGQTVYVRITNGEQSSNPQETTVRDETAPAKATIEPNKTSVIAGETLTAKVTHTDNETGVNISQSKWVLIQSPDEIGIGNDVIAQYTGNFTDNGETITLNSSATGTYYLHVLTVDNAGNRTETVSEAITISGISGTVSQKGNITWSAGKASIELETADDQFEIEYKINDGDWTPYDGPITGLNHGDTVTARLTNETTTGPEVQFSIQDTTDPVVTVSPGGTTSSSVTVSVSAVDNESGMIGNPTYTYQIKQSSQGDNSYTTPSDANNISSNSYTFKNLTQGTSYDVRVIVNGDVTGRTGTGTLANQQTGTIPGGEEGVQEGAITFGTATWQDGTASVTIATDTGMQLQYQKNATNDGDWTNIDNNGTVPDLKHGDTVYARLTDGTNFGDYASTNILDNEVPAQATIQPNTTNLLIGESLTATVTHSDAKSGVDINASGWVLNTNASAIGTDDTGAYTGKFTTNGETITLDSSNAGTYYLHVLTTDVAGNKTETVSEAITISAITGTVTQNGQVNWSAGQASISLTTTEGQYTIVYKINDAGSWQTYNGTSITGLSHGDTVTACLTNASQTTFGPEAEFEIKDETNPQVTVTAQGSPTTNSITVTAQASDNESGMKASPTYTFQIKQSTSGSYTTPGGASNISNAQYTFTGLTQGTSYDIQVIVNGDNAGNTGTGTLTNQTTATVPGADEGLITGSITASPASWKDYKASTTLTTATDFKIQYQVNGTAEGSWSEPADSPVTVSNLDHGNTVYARLTDGTNAGDYAAINILDGTPPTVSVEVGEVTHNSIAVTVNATDKESGLADSNAYRYYLNDEEAPRATSSSNTYKYEGLTATTPYSIKVEVVDKANNTGTGTTSATTAEPPIPDNMDEAKPNPEQDGPEFTKTAEIEDDLGNPVVIPGGFHIDKDSGTKVEEGIVIEDGSGNQFVWIPTGEYDVSTSINSSGKLTNNLSRRTFTTSGATEVSGDSAIQDGNFSYSGEGNSNSIAYNQIGAFKASAESVVNGGKGGFYIGRYELGTGNVVKAGVAPYTNITRDRAKSNIENMYKGNSYVTSELISSYAWDTALNFICQTNVESGERYNLSRTTSSQYGNINTGSKQNTGAYAADNYSNIHDLLGNCYEWTTEYCSNSSSLPCVYRGGGYDDGSNGCAAARSSYFASSRNISISARAQLYVK